MKYRATEKILESMLRFSNRSYSTTHKVLSMLPGTIIFLILSPLFVFFPSRILGHMMPLTVHRSLEVAVIIIAGLISMLLMHSALYVLWVHGKGTPAPIAPTLNLVTIGPYKLLRNPIELGTNIYFLTLGTWFDSLTTGIFCMVFGMILGLGYIKTLEEKELKLRFGIQYEEYKNSTPCMIPWT